MAAKALEWTHKHKIINHVCSDQEAVLACERFAGNEALFTIVIKLFLFNNVKLWVSTNTYLSYRAYRAGKSTGPLVV